MYNQDGQIPGAFTAYQQQQLQQQQQAMSMDGGGGHYNSYQAAAALAHHQVWSLFHAGGTVSLYLCSSENNIRKEVEGP